MKIYVSVDRLWNLVSAVTEGAEENLDMMQPLWTEPYFSSVM